MTDCRVFIGSSSEGIDYANAVFTRLESSTEPSTWDQIFLPSRSTIEELERFARDFDFAVLILTPDDERKMRGTVDDIPRDNVIFELGLFIGALGRDHVFFVVPKDYQVELPTDLLGVTSLKYSPRKDGDVRASVQTACSTILSCIEASTKQPRSPLLGFWDSVRARHDLGLDARSVMGSVQQRIFLSGITLNYIVQHCKDEISRALGVGVPVEFVIVANTNEARSMYERYSSFVSENLPLAHKRYRDYREGLSSDEAKLFNVYCTQLPLTHSIGLYDGRMFISEFCLDADSSGVPSYELAENGDGYKTFIEEVRVLLSGGEPLFGSEPSRILDGL